MTLRGHVRDGMIVLDDGAQLANGVAVRIEIVPPAAEEGPQAVDSLARMGDLAVETGVVDLASNLDYYLYGHPKATDGS